jgi:hypothetical protein
MLAYLVDEFGWDARRPAVKGENVDWYIDQRLISVLVDDWIKVSAAIGSNPHQAEVVRMCLSECRRKRVEVRAVIDMIDMNLSAGFWTDSLWSIRNVENCFLSSFNN